MSSSINQLSRNRLRNGGSLALRRHELFEKRRIDHYELAQPLENSLYLAVFALYEFFHANGYEITPTNWKDNKSFSVYSGWVYAFYGENQDPIYIGETGRAFSKRIKEHQSKDWWKDWKAARVFPCPNKATRKLFESLLGCAGGYLANKMQPSGADNFLDESIDALLKLGKSNQRLSCPNEMIANQTEVILSNLKEAEQLSSSL